MQPLLARVAKIRGYTTLMGLEKRQSSRWILGFSFKKQGVHVIGCKVLCKSVHIFIPKLTCKGNKVKMGHSTLRVLRKCSSFDTYIPPYN